MRTRIISVIAAVATIFSAGMALAHEFRVGDIEIDHPWSKAMIPGAKVAGGYLKIVNHGKEADKLVKVSTDIAGKSQIHEMKVENEVMLMSEVKGGLEIPAGGTVELKPGAFHIMFMDVPKATREGDKFKAVMTFEKAGSVEVEFEVDSPRGEQKMDHKHHMQNGEEMQQ